MLRSISAPHEYPCRVLLALGGMSPQVVTETLFALCIRRAPPFIPTEVRLITTTAGRDEAIDSLLDHDGKFHDFVRDYGLEGRITFTIDHLHPLLDADGHALDDVCTERENIAAADAIVERIRELTGDPDCALHVSIAGGRNPLGFYLGYALSIFGRPQDRLSHVYVPWEFQGIESFYYPPPDPRTIIGRYGRKLNTANAHVTLAEIPFVSLRHGLPDALCTGRATYSQTVSAIRRSFAPATLVIDCEQKKLWCDHIEVRMPPQLFSFYLWLANRRRNQHDNNGYASWRDKRAAEEFLGIYREVVGCMAHDYEAVVEGFAEGMPREFFQQKKARINHLLEDALGKPLAMPYLICSSGRRPATRFGLGLPPERIEILTQGNS